MIKDPFDRVNPAQDMPEHYWLERKSGKIYAWCASSLFLKTEKGNARFFADTPEGIAKAVAACWNDHNQYGGWQKANEHRIRRAAQAEEKQKIDLTEKQIAIILACLGDRADYYKAQDDWSLQDLEDVEDVIKLFEKAQAEVKKS